MKVLGRVFGHPIWNFIAMFLALLTYLGIKVDKITEYLSKHIDVHTVTEYSLLLIAIFLLPERSSYIRGAIKQPLL